MSNTEVSYKIGLAYEYHRDVIYKTGLAYE
jgi:hypothetical protein